MGEHINNGAKPPPDCLAVCMDRAFSPQSRYCLHSWGVAPGWYRLGLRPSRDCANNSSRPDKKRRRRKPYQPGATPQEEIQPQREQGLKARSIILTRTSRNQTGTTHRRAICRICMSSLRIEWSRSTSRTRTRSRFNCLIGRSSENKGFRNSTSGAGRAPKRMKIGLADARLGEGMA